MQPVFGIAASSAFFLVSTVNAKPWGHNRNLPTQDDDQVAHRAARTARSALRLEQLPGLGPRQIDGATNAVRRSAPIRKDTPSAAANQDPLQSYGECASG